MTDRSITFSLPHGFTVGGLTSWVIRMTDALLARGRHVQWVVHPPYQGFMEFPASSLPNHQHFRMFRSTSMLDSQNWQDWVRAYRETLPTILLPAVLAESYAVAAALSCVSADELRVIAWNHSDNPYDYAYLARYEPIVHRYVVNTTACENALQAHVSTRTKDIAFIPHGVSVCSDAPRDASRSRPIRIAYGGRFDQLVKRVLDFPELALRLCAMGIRFDMRLAGDGPQRAQLESAVCHALRPIRESGSSIRVEPPCLPSAMTTFWQWADVAMLMSVHEGLSVAMLEAMAAGCVPIVTKVESGVRDVIESGRNGLSFPVGDVDLAAKLIAQLATDAPRLRSLSAAARATIATGYSLESHVDRFISLIAEVEATEPRCWPAEMAVMARNTPASSSCAALTIPSDAAARLTALLNRIARDDAGPVLIYGAGGHTRALADVWASTPVEIAAVIDDDPGRHGETLWGWPILGLDDVGGLDANGVIISSWLHENAMWKRRAAFERSDMRVYRIYNENADMASGDSTAAAKALAR